MRILKIAAIAAVMVVSATASVHASVLGNLLSFDADPDVITDDSAGVFVERGTVDGILEVGDLIQGLITFDPIAGNAVPDGSSIVGAYSLEITAIGANGSTLSLGAATGDDSITSILGVAGADFSRLSGSYVGADNGFAVLETTSETVGRPDFNAPFDFGIPTSNFDVSAVLGFDGVDDQYTVVAGLNLLTPDPVDFVDLTDLSTIDSLAGTGLGVANFFGTFTVTDHSFGPSVVFLPQLNPLAGGAIGDVTILNGSISATNADTVGNGFRFNDDGDFNINAVPEPTTFAVWGGLAAAIAGFMSSRRK